MKVKPDRTLRHLTEAQLRQKLADHEQAFVSWPPGTPGKAGARRWIARYRSTLIARGLKA